MRRTPAFLLALIFTGCGDDSPAAMDDAATSNDATQSDGGVPEDAQLSDSGPADASRPDGGSVDAGDRDAGDPDAGDMDAGASDSATDTAVTNDSAVDAASDTASPDAGYSTGRLHAFQIAGIRYETDSVSGTTDAAGTFLYNEGESIRFSVGNVALGEAAAAEQLSLLDLADSPRPLTNREVAAALENDPSFVRLVATAIFLASFDDNGDLSDGVLITPEVAALLQSSDIELNVLGDELILDDFYRAMAAAQSNFSTPHRIAKPAIALTALYDQAGLDPRIVGALDRVIDRDADGSPDETNTHTYNEHGFRIRTTSTSGSRTAWTYTEDGYLTGQDRDNDGDEIDDERNRYDYNTVGLRTQWQRFREDTRTITYEYDDAGRLSRQTTDNESDGTIDTDLRYTYDTPFLQWTRLDTVRNGQPDGLATRMLDSQGRLVRLDSDDDGDGTFRVDQISYGSNRLTLEIDTTGDGTIEYTEISTFDANSNLIHTYGNDSGFEWEATFEYDMHGNLIRREADNGLDGMLDLIDINAYDEYNSLIRTESDNDADGTPDTITAWLFGYDADGNIVREQTDRGADGDVDFELSYTLEVVGFGVVEFPTSP